MFVFFLLDMILLISKKILLRFCTEKDTFFVSRVILPCLLPFKFYQNLLYEIMKFFMRKSIIFLKKNIFSNLKTLKQHIDGLILHGRIYNLCPARFS